jgi:hypothetical protein
MRNYAFAVTPRVPLPNRPVEIQFHRCPDFGRHDVHDLLPGHALPGRQYHHHLRSLGRWRIRRRLGGWRLRLRESGEWIRREHERQQEFHGCTPNLCVRLLASTGVPPMASGWLSAFSHRGFPLMLQKNPERESVRHEQQRHDQSWNEVGRSQLPGRKPAGIGLVEGVHEID